MEEEKKKKKEKKEEKKNKKAAWKKDGAVAEAKPNWELCRLPGKAGMLSNFQFSIHSKVTI